MALSRRVRYSRAGSPEGRLLTASAFSVGVPAFNHAVAVDGDLDERQRSSRVIASLKAWIVVSVRPALVQPRCEIHRDNTVPKNARLPVEKSIGTRQCGV